MSSKKSRVRAKRRDRRLAKKSNWTRPGKSNSSKVGHGGGGMITGKKQTNKPANKKLMKNIFKVTEQSGFTNKLGDYLNG